MPSTTMCRDLGLPKSLDCLKLTISKTCTTTHESIHAIWGLFEVLQRLLLESPHSNSGEGLDLGKVLKLETTRGPRNMMRF